MRTLTFDEALAACPNVTVEQLEHWKKELELEGLSCPAIDRRLRVLQGNFSEEDIATVKAAIRRARADMREWEKASRVDPVKMRTPLQPPRKP